MKNELESTLNHLKCLSLSPEREAELEAERVREAKRAKDERYAKIVAKSRLPIRYATPCQNLVGDVWKGHARSIARGLGTGLMIAICGNRGTGKTQMAAEVIHVAARKGLSCRYTTAMDFFLELRASFQKSSELTELQVVDAFASPALLVLDEAQERGESEWHDRMLTMLLDRRYANLRDTILVTNLLAKAFAALIGDSNLSRMWQMGGVIELTGESFRTPKRVNASD